MGPACVRWAVRWGNCGGGIILQMKRIRTAARNRSRERVAGMEIETYGTEVGEEFDYDDEDNDESELTRLNRENEKVEEELAGLIGKGKKKEDMARKDEEHARLKAAIARLRTKLGFLPMYPGEKEVMVRRAIEEYVLRKRQELEAGKSKKEMPAATPNLSSLKI